MKSDFYLQFENKFRGDRKAIIEKLLIYDSLIDLYMKNYNQISLLDIGCGRGEWLEKYKEIIPQSFGIEKDINMINLCKSLGLNVIRGDAIEVLKELQSGSQSVITIFHMIEHLNYTELTLLLDQCYRVLKDDGILIMETPSIDNLLVSSKLFYIDSTHVTHINPDRIKFELESLGFAKANYYFINGGPLEHAESLKLTRILNGVAQDLLIVACKGQAVSNLIFHTKKDWEKKLSQAPTTLEAASNFDLEIEQKLRDQSQLINDQTLIINNQTKVMNKQNNVMNKQNKAMNNLSKVMNNQNKVMKSQSKEIHSQSDLINIINQELSLCKDKISLLENRQLTLYKILFPLIKIVRFLKKIMVLVCTRIFSFMVNYRLTRSFLNSKYILFVIRTAFKVLPLNSSTFNFEKVYLALNKAEQIDIKSMNFNQKLLVNYNQSPSAKNIKNLLLKRVFRKI